MTRVSDKAGKGRMASLFAMKTCLFKGLVVTVIIPDNIFAYVWHMLFLVVLYDVVWESCENNSYQYMRCLHVIALNAYLIRCPVMYNTCRTCQPSDMALSLQWFLFSG